MATHCACVADNMSKKPEFSFVARKVPSERVFQTGGVTRINVCVVGDSGVGKTAIINRFITDRFEILPETVGGVYREKVWECQGFIFDFRFSDVGGQLTYRNIVPNYFRGVSVFIMVYDCANEDSFDDIEEWYSLIRRHCREDNLTLVLCGNKIDKMEQKVISTDAGKELAKRLGIMFQETSALSGDGVMRLFNKVCKESIKINIRRANEEEDRRSSTVNPSTVTLRDSTVKDSAAPSSRCCG